MDELKVVKCGVCGKVFKTYHHNKKYCSYECLKKAGSLRENKNKYLMICKNCGKHFYGRKSAMFCSVGCVDEYKSIKKQAKKCLTCVYSVILASGEPLCNYGAIMGVSRTALNEARRPCRLYAKKQY